MYLTARWKKMNELLEIYFEWQSDTLVQQILLIALVLKPIVHHPTRLPGEPLCFVSWKCHQDCWLSFETLKLLAPFPCYEFVLCFFLHRLSENPASMHFQGNPTKLIWKFSFRLDGSENNTTFLKFQNSRIFPETSYISGQMEYSFDSWIFV